LGGAVLEGFFIVCCPPRANRRRWWKVQFHSTKWDRRRCRWDRHKLRFQNPSSCHRSLMSQRCCRWSRPQRRLSRRRSSKVRFHSMTLGHPQCRWGRLAQVRSFPTARTPSLLQLFACSSPKVQSLRSESLPSAHCLRRMDRNTMRDRKHTTQQGRQALLDRGPTAGNLAIAGRVRFSLMNWTSPAQSPKSKKCPNAQISAMPIDRTASKTAS
jgi:hypothetical protein